MIAVKKPYIQKQTDVFRITVDGDERDISEIHEILR